MTLAPEHRPELLAMREEVTRLQALQYEAFKVAETSVVNAVKYDAALQRYAEARVAYEDALKKAIKEHNVEVHYGSPF